MKHDDILKLAGSIYGTHVEWAAVPMKKLKDLVKGVELDAQERFAAYLDSKKQHEAASLIRGLND